MNSDQILRWRDYLTGPLQERYGLVEKEAKKIADRWLRSRVGTRDRQGPSNQRLRTQPAASRARAASQGS